MRWLIMVAGRWMLAGDVSTAPWQVAEYSELQTDPTT